MTLEEYLEKNHMRTDDEAFRRITMAYCKTFGKSFDELNDQDTVRIMLTRATWTVVVYNAKCGDINITIERDICMDYRDRKTAIAYELKHGDRVIGKGNNFRTPCDWPIEKCMAEIVGWHDDEEHDIFRYLNTVDGGSGTQYVIEMEKMVA